MKPHWPQRRSSGPAARGPRFRPLVEFLEARIVPSTVDHSGGFASHSDLTFNGSAVVSSSLAKLTGGANQAGSVFTNAKVQDNQFTLDFTFQVQGSNTAGSGLTFTLENDSATALGGAGTAMGFTGSNSVAIFFAPATNQTGLMVSGQSETPVSVHNVNLGSQDLFDVTLTNDGSTLKETITDRDTGASFSHSFNVNIAQLIGSHMAFVGFTGGTGTHAATQAIHTFTGQFGPAQSVTLTASGVPTINGVEGQVLHFVPVATFSGPDTSAGCTATINWGDGTTSTGFITGPDQNGVFTVNGTHTYVEEGNSIHGGPFVITVTITCGSSTATATTDTAIAEAGITPTGGFTINAVEGQSFTATVATFVDTGGPENPNDPGDYTATINWGDGSTSTGTITLSGNVFTVTGTHTYAEDGENESDIVDTFTITTTIVHETVSATATSTALVSEETPPAPPQGININVVEGQTFTTAVASFTGTFTKAVINWGDGTTSLGTISGPNSNGVFFVNGTHTYVEEGNAIHGGNPFTITTTLFDGTPVSVTSTATVAEAPLSATGGFTINAVENQAFTAVVAIFIDTGGPENPNDPGDYTATINWGDGTTSTGTITLSSGVFTVTGTHTYAEDGENESDVIDVFPITTTIVHETVSATAVSTALVSEETPPAPPQGININVVEGQTFTTAVATFTGTFTKAVINWGDGTASLGTISGPNSNGVFTVIGTHKYIEEGNAVHGGNPFTITTTLFDGTPVSVTSTANVAEAPLVATGGFTINAVETQPFTAVVATFVDTGGPENPNDPGDYNATINWGDGTTSTGTITLSSGVFTVTGTHSYAEDGVSESDLVDVFPITTTIVHETVSATAVSTALVSEAPVPTPGPEITLNGVEGQALSNVVVATFRDGNEPASDFTATISWGDGTTSLGTVVGPNSNGIFTVIGSHTFAEESNAFHGNNPYIITVTIHDQINVTMTAQAFMAEAPIIGTGGLTVNGVEGQSFTAPVATFIDTGGPQNPNDPGDYTATINWGDGTTSTGTITLSGNVFTVTGTHAYVEETNEFHGTPTITVTIVHETAPPITVTDTPSIAEAPIVGTGGLTVSGVEGQSFTAPVATFIDTGGPQNPNDPGDYTATINWGDGTTSTGTITLSGNVFTVTGTHAYVEETNESHGTPTITVTIVHETAPAITVTDTPSIAEAPLSATAGSSVSAVVGQDVTAAVATFTDTGGPEDATLDYAASIDWGDGTTTTGTISAPDQNGVFTVTGDHTYAAQGSFTINVTIAHESAPAVVVSTSASVAAADMPLTATGMAVTAVSFQGQDQTVAFFTDADLNAQVGDYVAAIDWGDGTQPDTGTITQPGGTGTPFFVDFMHAYNNDGAFIVHVHITDMAGVSDSGGAFADAFGTATVAAVAAPGGGDASLLGQGPAGLKGLQASPVQQVTPVPVMTAHAPASSQPSTASNDLYWSLYSSRGNRLADATAWAADELALAWQGMNR